MHGWGRAPGLRKLCSMSPKVSSKCSSVVSAGAPALTSLSVLNVTYEEARTEMEHPEPQLQLL